MTDDMETQAQTEGKSPQAQAQDSSTESNGVSESATTEAGNLIELSNKASERSEKAAVLLKKENDRSEQIAIKNQLAGKGQATQTLPPVDPKVEAANERIKAIGKASGAKWADDMDKKEDGN